MTPLHKTLLYSFLASVTAAMLTAVAADSSKHRAPQTDQSRAAAFTSIQEQLEHTATLNFRDVLQDAADETISVESDVAVQVTAVAADPTQCRLSYRQRVQRDDNVTDQPYQVSFGDVEEIRVELFEKYENEFTPKPGLIYVRSTPSISAVEMIHPDRKANWFAFADEAAANRLADTLSAALKLCKPAAVKS